MSGLRPFALHRPASVAEASRALGERGPDAMLYAGGTELLVLLKAGFVRPRWLIDVKRVPELGGIAVGDGGDVVIGATATHREVERSAIARARCPLVAGVARHVANVRVRAVGTVGGNLAFADPHSDLATLCLVFDARVALQAGATARELPLGEFVRGPYETARRDDELLTAVRLRPWPAGTAGAYVKFGVHERPTLAVAVALVPAGADRDGPRTAEGAGRPGPAGHAPDRGRGADQRVASARIALGCVGPRPERRARVEAAIQGLTAAEIGRRASELGALAADGVDAIDDLHGSAEYKRDMTRVFVARALALAAARLEGREPDVRYAHAVAV